MEQLIYHEDIATVRQTFFARLAGVILVLVIAIGLGSVTYQQYFSPPTDEAIRSAITRYSGDSNMQLDHYVIEKTQKALIANEEVVSLTWDGYFSVKPELAEQYAASSSLMPVQYRTGVVMLAKRGSFLQKTWYVLESSRLGTLDRQETQTLLKAYETNNRVAHNYNTGASGVVDANVAISVSETIGQNVAVVSHAEANQQGLSVNGNAIFSGTDSQYHRVLKVFRGEKLAGSVMFLMASVGANGNSCEAQFFIVTITPKGEVSFSPEFGNCSPKAQYYFDGHGLRIDMEADGKTETTIYTQGMLLANSTPISLDPSGANNPSK
jgi:hypothetical protein